MDSFCTIFGLLCKCFVDYWCPSSFFSGHCIVCPATWSFWLTLGIFKLFYIYLIDYETYILLLLINNLLNAFNWYYTLYSVLVMFSFNLTCTSIIKWLFHYPSSVMIHQFEVIEVVIIHWLFVKSPNLERSFTIHILIQNVHTLSR